MGRGPGVSVSRVANGRWRVRWRETVLDESTGESRSVQRERVVEDESTAIELRAKVLRSIETGEIPEVDPVRRIPAVASVDAVFAGYLRSRKALGMTQSTIDQYAFRSARALRVFRGIGGIPVTQAVPGTWLTRDRLIELTNQLRTDSARMPGDKGKTGRPLSEASVHTTVALVLAAWTWASDDPATYPGLAAAPRDPSSVLPRSPTYKAAPAPTMAECDAVIRRLKALPRSQVSLPVTVIARCTGLRVAQVLALTVGDVNLSACTLAVRTGKSRLEKLGRVVPIVDHLRDWLVPFVANRPAEDQLIRRRSDAGDRAAGATNALARVWTAATGAGEVRSEAWAPEGRVYRRPDHAFRAAFQHHLVTAGIRDEVIDALVGHSRGIRARHYVSDDARWEAMKAAVATIPPITWAAEEAQPSNVVPMKR